eukprot:m.193360 g.193360  ORF g.193360 m.193360 type:complete len:174 (+) comp24978_c3_seq4:344-865(+)
MGRRDKASQPNDVARKEAKKKELKKNKKQRQLVREIVAKQQDPKKLHLELDALREKEQACETQFARLPWIDKQSKVQASIREAVEYLEKNEPEKFKEYKQWKYERERAAREKPMVFDPHNRMPTGGAAVPPPPPPPPPPEVAPLLACCRAAITRGSSSGRTCPFRMYGILSSW